jgi:hypothetical protein
MPRLKKAWPHTKFQVSTYSQIHMIARCPLRVHQRPGVQRGMAVLSVCCPSGLPLLAWSATLGTTDQPALHGLLMVYAAPDQRHVQTAKRCPVLRRPPAPSVQCHQEPSGSSGGVPMHPPAVATGQDAAGGKGRPCVRPLHGTCGSAAHRLRERLEMETPCRHPRSDALCPTNTLPLAPPRPAPDGPWARPAPCGHHKGHVGGTPDFPRIGGPRAPWPAPGRRDLDCRDLTLTTRTSMWPSQALGCVRWSLWELGAQHLKLFVTDGGNPL